MFVFPQGLVHFQHNVGTEHSSAAWAWFNSENHPGTMTIRNIAVFGSKPSISRQLVAKAFQIDEDKMEEIQSKGILKQQTDSINCQNMMLVC